MSLADRLVTRQEWGATRAKARTALRSPLGNTAHYEGPKIGTPQHSQCASMVRGIQRFHMQTRGWSDIAYSSMFCPHGDVFEGRWLGVRTAAQGTNTGNDTHYAHCFLGGKGDPLTDDAKAAFVDVVSFFRANGSGPALKPHKFWRPTECPGEALGAFIAGGLPTPGPTSPRPMAPGGVPGAVGVIARPGGGGWIVAQDGGVFAIGTTPFFGSMGGQALAQPVVGGAATPSGQGYWLVAADGGIFAFGDATFHGTVAGTPLSQPIVAMASTPDGGGYWLAGTDGGVFALGNAVFAGSLGGTPLAAPIVAIAAGAHGGYVMAGADGGVFAFGTAFAGAVPAHTLQAPINSIVTTPGGNGYWLFANDGGVFAIGDAPFRGVYSELARQWARGERRVLGGAFAGDAAVGASWGYDLFSDRLPVERYHFAPA